MSADKNLKLSNLTLYKTLADAKYAGEFVAKVEGKGLSTNDFTDADNTKLIGIAAGAQVNVIESITIDGTAQTITNKGVALDLSDYAKKSDVASALNYKGTVANFAALPASNNTTGDVYNITTAGGTDANGTAVKAGDNVAYNGTGWDVLAGTTDLSGYVEKVNGKGLSTNDFTDAYVAQLANLAAEEVATSADIYAMFPGADSLSGGSGSGSGE